MDGLVAIGRIHLVGGFAIASCKASGANGVAERTIEAGRIFGSIGHDLHIFVPGVVQCFADGGDTAIHHVRWGDDIASGMGLVNCLFAQHSHGGVIDDFAFDKDAVMAMVGERVERNIADHTKPGMCGLDRAHGAADQIVTVARQRAVIVLQGGVNRRENGYGRYVQPDGFAGRAHQPVNAVAHDARHCCHSFRPVVALNHEQRPDQVINRKPCFSKHAAGKRLHPVAAHARGWKLTSTHPRSKRLGWLTRWPLSRRGIPCPDI